MSLWITERRLHILKIGVFYGGAIFKIIDEHKLRQGYIR